ncbi:MAG: hypothetical protein KFB95_04180 [Simkaniaceae bacterium]|nr:MAG: hypothetical protein KFB95_04180 [Simkaniaceae bacterium]
MKKTKIITSLVFSAMTIILGCFIYLKPFSKQIAGEQDEISLFLENVMIRENGIYTLLGSKPITSFRIENEKFPQSREEVVSEYKRLIDDNPSFEARLSFVDYETSVNEAKNMKHLRHEELWASWIQAYGDKKSAKYLFISRPSPHAVGNEGFFVNIPMTTYTLSIYQELFQKRTGIIFDPKQILKEIFSEHSEFWEKVFKDHFLIGILLGYGKRNAFIWELEDQASDTLRCDANNLMIDDSEYSKILVKEKITISDLLIPFFISYSIFDLEIEKYWQERESIINTISQTHFSSQILKLLGYEE